MFRKKFSFLINFFIYFLFVSVLFNIELFIPDLINNNKYIKIVSLIVFFIITIIFVLVNKKILSPDKLQVLSNLGGNLVEEDQKETDREIERLEGMEKKIFDYDAILNSVNTLILVVDEKLDSVYINKFGKDRLGDSYSESILKIGDFVNANFLKELKLNINDVSKTFYLETKIKLANKKTIATSVFISKLFENEDIFSGMVIVFNDISKQKRAELSLNNQINFSKQIFKTIPDIILITDMDLRVIFANNKADSILAKNPDENRKIFNYLSKDSIENGFDEYLRQIITRGVTDKQINVQNPFISEDGFVDIEIVPLKSGEKIIGGLMLVKDITEWISLTEELKNLENFNRKMINSSPYAIISVNEEDIVSGWNERATEVFGIKSNEIIGANIFEIFPSIEIIRDEINEAKIIEEPTFLSDKEIELLDGKNIDVEIALYPVYSKEKNVVINIKDISELKKLESSLVQAKNMGSLGLLTSKIVHDLNNVLSGITGYTSLLDKKVEKDSNLRKYVNRLLASSDRATEIIKQTLSFSKTSSSTNELIYINELIKETVNLLNLRIGKSKVTLDLSREILQIRGSKIRFSQAIMNLFVNANDALLNSENPEIIITTTFRKSEQNKKSGEIIISVIDNGIGIKEEEIEKIFDVYFTTKTEDKGTGLGLANVKEIIEELGGTISVKSDFGFGSEFILSLPWAEDKKGIRQKEDMESFEITNLGINAKVLLVDDEETVREIGVEILELLGLECITAIDGVDGILKFEENKDDLELIILDVEMPKKQGNEVYDFIKKAKPDMKVLIASGYGKEYLEKDIFRKTIPEYIAKPFQLNELGRKIKEMIK